MIHIPSPSLFVINLVITQRSWKPEPKCIKLTSTLSCRLIISFKHPLERLLLNFLPVEIHVRLPLFQIPFILYQCCLQCFLILLLEKTSLTWPVVPLFHLSPLHSCKICPAFPAFTIITGNRLSVGTSSLPVSILLLHFFILPSIFTLMTSFLAEEIVISMELTSP